MAKYTTGNSLRIFSWDEKWSHGFVCSFLHSGKLLVLCVRTIQRKKVSTKEVDTKGSAVSDPCRRIYRYYRETFKFNFAIIREYRVTVIADQTRANRRERGITVRRIWIGVPQIYPDRYLKILYCSHVVTVIVLEWYLIKYRFAAMRPLFPEYKNSKSKYFRDDIKKGTRSFKCIPLNMRKLIVSTFSFEK